MVAYANGVKDLKTGIFRKELRCDDYLTKTIPYDYKESTPDERRWVRNELKKICNYNEAHLEYYLSFLGYSMTGDASIIQKFVSIVGEKASNGKSVIFEALMNIIPCYIKKLGSDVFEEATSSQRHKIIAELNGVRIAWINEITKKTQDREFMKDIADGTIVPYKVMYGTTADMIVTFKTFLIGNHKMTIKSDNGIQRRFIHYQLDSDFTDDITEDDYDKKIFKKDTQFRTKLETTYKYALMDIIYDYAKQFVKDGNILKPYPTEWLAEVKETCKQNNKFEMFIEEKLEIGEDFEISNIDLTNQIKYYYNSRDVMLLKDIKSSFKSARIKFEYNSQKEETIDKIKKKGFWTGFKLKE
jgi:hypothetical protein